MLSCENLLFTTQHEEHLAHHVHFKVSSCQLNECILLVVFCCLDILSGSNNASNEDFLYSLKLEISVSGMARQAVPYQSFDFLWLPRTTILWFQHYPLFSHYCLLSIQLSTSLPTTLNLSPYNSQPLDLQLWSMDICNKLQVFEIEKARI